MRKLQRVAQVLLSILVVGAAPAVAQTLEAASPDERIDVLLQSYHELEQFDGAALVARDGVVLLDRGYGLASREFAVPNGGDIRYRLASISKTFTAVLVMQLVDEGRLSLDAPLSELLPGYRADTGSRVRLRHLLGHSSGIPDYFRVAGGWAAFAARVDTESPAKPGFAAELCSGDLEFDPGTQWSYSNCGYFLLGMIIERITGEPFDRVLQARIFDAAGMHDSGDEGADPLAVIERLASSYIRTPDGVRRQGYWNMATAFAAGSLYATPRDLMRYDRALADETLLSAGARQQMFTLGVGGWGLGWEMREAPIGPDGAVRRVATHEGFLFGSHTRIYRVLDDDLLVVLLSNAGDAPLELMAAGVFDVLYGRQPV
ncbi:MAG TPA: serine hydrolase domain-containing protein, partial [Chondromyces sp.]|nr:serine hydrolase domain-containing protein [Chondromyces sp.]